MANLKGVIAAARVLSVGWPVCPCLFFGPFFAIISHVTGEAFPSRKHLCPLVARYHPTTMRTLLGLRHGQCCRRAGSPALFLISLKISIWTLASSLAAAPSPDLGQAVYRGETAAWRALLQQKADVNAPDSAGNTALHFAALNHDLAAVTALLAAGATVDARNAAQATPLIYGAAQPEIVRQLLARGADVRAVSTLKTTPLAVAASAPNGFEAVKLLLDAGGGRGANDKESLPLARAVRGGDRRTLEVFLARGAAKDAAAAASALRAAAAIGDVGATKALLDHGADPNLNPTFTGHALNHALLTESPEVAQLLIEQGADLRMPSTQGHAVPTMVLAGHSQAGNPAAARALVARGVDVNAADLKGETALSYARRNGSHTPLVKYLESVGATSNLPMRAKRSPERPVPDSPVARAALVRARLPATLTLLQHSSNVFLDNGRVERLNCTSCHGQDLPAKAYALARERGFSLDEMSIGRQISAKLGRWMERGESARQLTSPVPGAPVAISYGLFEMASLRYESDAMTDSMVRYLLRTQASDGSWIDPSTPRPPIEDGSLVSTGWVTLSVRDYTPVGYEREKADALARAARWLVAQKPATHNERAFQLLGLHWSGVPAREVGPFVQRLVAEQRADGGWGQLAGLDSDAWATGTALYALHEAGEMPATHPVYQKGVAFLLRTQFEDGSWWVRTRTWPFQPHFNGEFPHGKDQWISQGGTAWAAMALLLTLDPVSTAAPAPTGQQLVAAYVSSPAAQRRKVQPPTPGDALAGATIDFTRDIQPILERSCTGCHGGEKPRAGFTLASRDEALKGGNSGETLIVPGYADDSVLLKYITGKIEDLEMPPLDKREKYPALTAAEIGLLRTWIDVGAPWSTQKLAGSGQP